MSDATNEYRSDAAADPCQCELCQAARAKVAAYADAGPKVPKDDDDDNDDDVALCDCKVCHPAAIPEGDALITAVKAYAEGVNGNYNNAAKYGVSLTRHLAECPMPPAIEAVALQYAIDYWNAADRAMHDLLIEAKKIVDDAPSSTLAQKTLDDALGLLARRRANRPRLKSRCRSRRSRVDTTRLIELLVEGIVGKRS